MYFAMPVVEGQFINSKRAFCQLYASTAFGPLRENCPHSAQREIEMGNYFRNQSISPPYKTQKEIHNER